MKKDRNILIISAPLARIKTAISEDKQLSSFQWVYFGKNVKFGIELESDLGKKTRFGIGDLLQETARTYRQEYIDYIGELAKYASKQQEMGCWWLTSLSEKNPFVSDVYLYFCYIKIFQNITTTIKNNLVIICEDGEIANSLYLNIVLKSEESIRLIDENSGIYHDISHHLLSLKKKIWFLFYYSYRKSIASFFSVFREKMVFDVSGKQVVCIHAFTDIRSITSSHHYQNAYIPKIGAELEKRNIPYFYLIDVLPTISFYLVCKKMIKYPENYCFVEEFFSFYDIIRALRSISKITYSWDSVQSMAGIKMGSILSQELKRDRLNTRSEASFLRYCSGKTISAFSLRTFVYIFENHMWEKMFCKVLKKESPATLIVGYAHTVVNPMYTCYTTSDKERSQVPLPDRIVVNGPNAKSVLEKSGFPEHSIEVLGALRYSNLKKRPFEKKVFHENLTILVALSTSVSNSIEILCKIISSLGNVRDIKIIIKCHPTIPFESIFPHIGNIPGNFDIRDDPVGDLLLKADVLIYSESTVCVEALALGVPVINIKSDYTIDMNILAGIPGILSLSSADEILDALYTVTSPESLRRFNEIQSVVNEIFAPLRDDFIEILIND
jgi:hypothetical protein